MSLRRSLCELKARPEHLRSVWRITVHVRLPQMWREHACDPLQTFVFELLEAPFPRRRGPNSRICRLITRPAEVTEMIDVGPVGVDRRHPVP